jgi:FkbM family methyltransferase
MIASSARVDISISPYRGLGHVSIMGSADSNRIHVEAISLDYFILSHPASNLLKCDVERAEFEVFQGAELLLREKRPILLVEMCSLGNHRILAQKFGPLGYPCGNLVENHVQALPQ